MNPINPTIPTNSSNIVEARSVTKVYPVGGRRITVLREVSLSVDRGEFLVVRGSSGSGKTTLLTLLSGLDHPTDGRVFIAGREITGRPEDELAGLRNETIGFVFQSFHLVPALTAQENVMFPAELRGDRRAGEKAAALLERVGMTDRGQSLPYQLSGGEKQRVAICRALINSPQVVFADEPTGNLDSENGRAVLDLLADLHREHRTTLIMVTHNAEIAGRADRVVSLRDGELVAEGRK